jgi:hypothetical protein
MHWPAAAFNVYKTRAPFAPRTIFFHEPFLTLFRLNRTDSLCAVSRSSLNPRQVRLTVGLATTEDADDS